MKRINQIRNVVLFLALLFGVWRPAPAQIAVGIGVSVRIAPPALPVYVQPACPTPGYLWTPGYWAYGSMGYYWVPGVWVAPPRPGLLWTPGYWGFAGGLYGWHAGFWGPRIGFYGGVNYGFGYPGTGFVGGMWSGGVFRYNTAVVNVNRTVIHNTYVNNTVVNNTTVNRTSFNGPGGINVRPTPQQQAVMHQPHVQATPNQMSHQQMASQNRSQLASYNGGRPQTTAMNSVNGREFNQQQRIGAGVSNGQLNPRQTQHLEGEEARTNQQVRAERQANAGKLNRSERQQVNREQNRESRQIERDRHEPPRERR